MCPGQWVGFFSRVSCGSLDYELKKSDHRIAVVDLATGQRKTLIPGGSHAEYFEPVPGEAGYLVYAAAGTLRAVRFDPVRLEVLGDPGSVVEQVLTKANGTANFSVSRTGAVAYVAGGVAVTPVRTLRWVDRQGREESIPAPAARSHSTFAIRIATSGCGTCGKPPCGASPSSRISTATRCGRRTAGA